MIASYYGYYIEDTNGERYLLDIVPLIETFINNATREQKRFFTLGDEHQYLFRENDRFYMYVLTRSKELIKAIDENTIQHIDLYQRLQNNEEVGFASYIYFDTQNFFSYFSSFLAPRVRLFTIFLNDLIINGTNSTDYHLGIEPFLTQATREEALNMEFIGKTTIEIPHESSVGRHLKNFFLGDDNITDLSSFRIEIKPKRGGNIKEGLGAILSAVPEESAKKFILKTKEDLADKAMDIYLCGQNIVRDTIDKGSSQTMYDNVINNIRRNSTLEEKVSEFTSREDFSDDSLEHIGELFNRTYPCQRD